MLQLTADNYYSLEANQEYMSYSQYKEFLDCEARAMAKIWGGWEEPPSQAFLVGSYVHAYFEGEGALKNFILGHPEIFKKDGTLKAEFKVADEMIDTIVNDEMCMAALEGEKEKIVVFEFGNCMWKMKADVLNLEKRRVVDLKNISELGAKVWNNEKRYYELWLEAYGYIGQMALYQKGIQLAYNVLVDPIILAVTKQDPPDKALIYFDDDRLNWELSQIIFYLPRVLAVKNGQEKPRRCEMCKYCRETKKLREVMHYSDLYDYM